MRLLIPFLSVAAVLSAASPSSVTLRELSGYEQYNRTVTVPRFFARGEFMSCIQANVNGMPLTTQNDVRTYWPDGSTQFTNLSFVVPFIAANESIAVEFLPDANCGNWGEITKDQLMDDAAPWAAALGAEIRTFNDGTAQSANLRTMLSAWDGSDAGVNGLSVRYWLKGPVVTQLIVEDRTPALTHDFGWSYDGSAWVVDTTHKGLHPIFVITVWPGQATVKIEAVLENTWTTKLSDQKYDLDILLGNPLSSESPATDWVGNSTFLPKASLPHFAKTRWRRVFWSGTAPSALKVDLNLPYMTSSGAVPNYDLTLTPSLATVTTTYPNLWANATTIRRDFMGEGLMNRYMPEAGQTAADHVGLIPTWGALYLYAMGMGGAGNELLPVVIGNADVMGHWPSHNRESRDDPAKKYCALSCSDGREEVDAFGRIMSIDARPTWRPNSQSGVEAADATTPVATLSTYFGAAAAGMPSNIRTLPEESHEPDPQYVAYLITGDYFYLEEMQFWSSWNLGVWGTADSFMSRNGSAGTFQGMQERGQAWSLRTLAETAAMSPTGSPEKQYHERKLANNASCYEGYLDITDGAYGGVYEWGRCNDTTKVRLRGPNPLNFFYGWRGMYPGGLYQSNVITVSGAAPMVVTQANHSRVTGDKVFIRTYRYAPVTGPWHGCWTVTRIDADHYSLDGSNGAGADFSSLPLAEVRRSNGPSGDMLLDPCLAVETYASWQHGFLTAGFNHARRLGYSFDRIVRAAATLPLNAMYGTGAPSDKRIWVGGSYWPAFSPDNPSEATDPNFWRVDRFLTSIQDMVAAFSAPYMDAQTAGAVSTGPYATAVGWAGGCSNPSGYPHIMQAALAAFANYTVDGFSGREAYNWAAANVEHQELKNNNPKWAFVPETEDALKVVEKLAGDTFVILGYRPPKVASSCTVNGQADNQEGKAERQYVVAGLAPAANVTLQIQCGANARSKAVVAMKTQQTLQGASRLWVKVSGPGASMEYGSTPALGQTVSSGACVTMCTLQVTVDKGLYYYRLRRASGQVGRIQAVLVDR